MRRLLFSLLCLTIIALPHAHGQGAANTLTPEEVSAGWLLLFDGATTFGWKIDGEAKVENGVLVLGGTKETKAAPTTRFVSEHIRYEMKWTGEEGPTIGSGRGDVDRVTLPRETRNKFAESSIRSSVPGGQPRPPLSITAPAGTRVMLRNVKLQPYPDTIATAAAEAAGGKPELAKQVMKSLFNGKDLTGWKVFQGEGKKSKYTVTPEGWLNVKDGPGDIQTTGDYKNFLLQLECVSNGEHLNSGLFFRCLPDQYQQGYEAQIRNQFTAEPTQTYAVEKYDPRTHELVGKETVQSTAFDFGTGAIYRRVPARKGVSKDREWFTLTLLADGRHLSTWVNGVQQVDWTDNRPLSDNARKGCCLDAGRLSIQGHDPTTDLSFRNLRVAELP